MFARFPFLRTDAPEVTDWLVETVVKCKLDPRVSSISKIWINDTPITMGRNKAVEAAKAARADFLVMIDNDMKPDAYLGSNTNRLDIDSSAQPFWDSSWDFMLRHYDHGPCMIGAPYCGPPPHENVYVFRWATYQSDHPNADLHIEQFTREEAVERAGFEEVACLPTGLVLIDMRVFDNPLVTPPYFSYEWTDAFAMKKASTEDCVFTRDLNLANIPLYVNWDAWAGHWKMKCVGRPRPIFREQVSAKFVQAVEANVSNARKIRCVHSFEADAPSIRQALAEEAQHAAIHPSATSQSIHAGTCPGAGDSGAGPGPNDNGTDQSQSHADTPPTEVPRGSHSIGIVSRRPLAYASDSA